MKGSSSIKRWNNRDEIPLDEVDQFHEQRDKILLEGEEFVPDSDADDDEVFALNGLEESSESDGDLIDSDEVDEEEEEEEEEAPATKSISKTKPPKNSVRMLSEISEEEPDEEEEEESWGKKKSAYYSSNAAQLESDDEEAHEMEEQEAKRLQAKLREVMHEEDFGFGEALQNTIDSSAADNFWKPVEKPTVAAVGSDKMSILRHLEKTSPETLALAQEWEDVARSIMKTEQKLPEMETADGIDKALGLIHLFHQTQLTYAALLGFYLHLRASKKYSARPDLLRQHPILKRLLTLKQSLSTLEDLNFGLSDSDDDDSDLDDDMSDTAIEEIDTWLATRKQGLDVGELEELLAGTEALSSGKTKLKLKIKAPLKPEQPPKKKQKVAKGKALPDVTFDVEEPTLIVSGTSSSSRGIFSADGYGEATALDSADVADKGVRRKALRFHTSKIESANARRQGARNALGGDDDVPYRDRKKQGEKQKRANLGAGGEDLDDAEPEAREQTRKREREEQSDGGSSTEDDDNGYYSLVKKQKKAKAAQKKG
ncbi:hypothetical protein EW145_g1944 [Phellinidium pouzarii]|uniref:Sas10 C-terminal domain-containing protein n=1 Tax=Phellinidium pouzarii TaxID=167371 RepID=A0A4V3XDF8_9AGAM|nr:hypothetical protein EW145_g1944 [Phellinidium pouzarii]